MIYKNISCYTGLRRLALADIASFGSGKAGCLARFSQLEDEKGMQARQMILDYLAQNPLTGENKNGWFSRNKKIIISALLILLIVVALVSGWWGYRQLQIHKLNQTGQQFLQANSLAMIFEGQIPLPPLLSENQKLLDEIEKFENGTVIAKLVPIKNKLIRWRQQAIEAKAQQLKIQSLFDKMSVFDFETIPAKYPDPDLIEKADSLEQELRQIQSSFVIPSSGYILKLQEKLRLIDKYNISLEKKLTSCDNQLQQLQDRFNILANPEFFDLSLLKKYQQIVSDTDTLSRDRTVVNASRSHRQHHRRKAQTILLSLSEIKMACQSRIEGLNLYRSNAESFINTFNIKYHLGASAPEKILAEIDQLKLLAESAEKFWPGNPVNKKIKSDFADIKQLDILMDIDGNLEGIYSQVGNIGNIEDKDLLQKNIDTYRRKIGEISSALDLVEPKGSLSSDKKEQIQSKIDKLYEILDKKSPKPALDTLQR